MNSILFLDMEITPKTQKLGEIGFVLGEEKYKGSSIQALKEAFNRADFLCGHNILQHDIPALERIMGAKIPKHLVTIDTLYLSPIFRPNQQAHFLNKEYKFFTEWKNDPLADSLLSKKLLLFFQQTFEDSKPEFASILKSLLYQKDGFKGFFQVFGLKVKVLSADELLSLLPHFFQDRICRYAPLEVLIEEWPVELAYMLCLLDSADPKIITPSWLLHAFPNVQQVFDLLRTTPCNKDDCSYCRQALNPIAKLQKFFGYESFRRFEGDGDIPLQEQAVRAALKNESFLAIFPTGGGKSLTFQLPALMRGEATGALTVVISPLQALMKDQIDVLRRKDIVNAVTINGLLDPLQRAEAIQKVEEGFANLLYISPESLRSNTILRLLKGRQIDRFVIDEAHCFSAWGQDFRVDYLYIGKFIQLLEEEKGQGIKIPVSCFTATARPEVVTDIQHYFEGILGLDLKLYQTHQQRTNLSYRAVEADEKKEKFEKLLSILEEREGPAIIYVSRVKKTLEISEALCKRGVLAKPYNGKMESKDKNEVQDAFTTGEIDVIVATSAFGMGVDKDDVSLVVHYEISNSLENYVQEAGRAGRDPSKEAKCVILYNENDLNKHFALLQATKLNIKEISQIWNGIKRLGREWISKSALQIAKKAGWDEDLRDLETRVKAAVNALESAGYLERKQNSPNIFAKGLIPPNYEKAWQIVKEHSFKLTDQQREYAQRILQYLYGKTETRVDYMAEHLGIRHQEVSTVINILKEINVLMDGQDLTATLDISQSKYNAKKSFQAASKVEPYLYDHLISSGKGPVFRLDFRLANAALEENGIPSNIPLIRNIIRYWEWKRFIKKERLEFGNWNYKIILQKSQNEFQEEIAKRIEWSERILEKLTQYAHSEKAKGKAKERLIEFSVVKLKKEIEYSYLLKRELPINDYESYLLYLQNIESINLKDGLLVYYNRLNIQRLIKDNKKRYTKDDYKQLEKHYEKKVAQIHIVGSYAERLLKNYSEALAFTDDYFKLAYGDFLDKYFPKSKGTLGRPLTRQKFHDIFKNLDLEQLAVVKDQDHSRILVAAGPGSGKTRVLVHKMASLLLLEDIKPEQFLMLTFSRPAANELRQRLRELTPELGSPVDIFTYHSFAFHLLGKMGSLKMSENVLELATEAIREKTIPLEKVAAKGVLVLDEFQDVSKQEFDFLEAILEASGEIRLIAAGDDDQSIYEFRGSNSQYMENLVQKENSKIYYLSKNYRSKSNIVDFSNQFLSLLPQKQRIKSNQLLRAQQKDEGGLRLIKYTNGGLVLSITTAIQEQNLKGETALLTATNEQALQAASLLWEAKVPAILVANQKGFRLKNLAELRCFTEIIKQKATGEFGAISDQCWTLAKEEFQKEFYKSNNRDLSISAIEGFEREFSQKFLSDWLEYLSSLKHEDFFFPSRDMIQVSTIHKAKGKEFDNVFILLDNFEFKREEDIRAVYVGITRAKNHLEVHTNQTYFDHIQVKSLDRSKKSYQLNKAHILVLSAGLQDVYLGFFQNPNIQTYLYRVRAGQRLEFKNDPYPSFYNERGQKLGSFSQAFNKSKIQPYLTRGYRIREMVIENVVWWWDREREHEYQVVLPRITFGLT